MVVFHFKLVVWRGCMLSLYLGRRSDCDFTRGSEVVGAGEGLDCDELTAGGDKPPGDEVLADAAGASLTSL